MKKLVAIALLASTATLSGCSIDWNDEKDRKIAELERQAQENSFQKKQKCMEYENVWKQRAKDYSSNYQFSSVFYSSKADSCMVRLTSLKTRPQNVLLDVFSGNEIAHKDDYCLSVEKLAEKDDKGCYNSEVLQKTFNEFLN